EDGIRDGHVTGVQTCALPISGLVTLVRVNRRRKKVAELARILNQPAEKLPKQLRASANLFIPECVALPLPKAGMDMATVSRLSRSEERRVGNAGTSWGCVSVR